MAEELTKAAINATIGQPLVDLAQSQIARAVDGYSEVAKEIIKQAIVGIKQAIDGDTIDAERLIYLAYIGDALNMIILENVEPKKALCLSQSGRPKMETLERDMALFFQVGKFYSEYKKGGGEAIKPIEYAIKQVAKKKKIGVATVKKAWDMFGGVSDWKRIVKDNLQS